MGEGAPLIRVGITTMALDPPARFRELVRAVEDGGFDELWVCDSSLHARDVYAYLTLVAADSGRLAFGPNCTHPYTRHPAVTLNAMATLHELSGGRARIAVGAGDRPVGELACASAPVAVVREMVGVLRTLQRGETISAAGPAVVVRDARLVVPLPSPLPIYVSASGPRMLRLGGETADGVLAFPGVHGPCVEYALEQIRAGAAGAGRSPGDLDLACTVAGSLQDDLAAARRDCVPMAAWFPQTAPRYAELAGVPPAVAAGIRAAYAGGHFDGARGAFAHVTDEMVDRFTVAGPADLWIRRLKDVVALGFAHVNIFLLARDRLAMVRDLATKVLPHVRSG